MRKKSPQNSSGEKLPGTQEMLGKIQKRKQRSQNAGKATEPEVGIFWDVDGKLIIATVPLSEAEMYGRFRNYPIGHDKAWETFQRMGTVPTDMAYDDPPRARVLYDMVSDRFFVYADACILRNETMLKRVLQEMQLPSSTKVGPDEHYRCRATCLRGVRKEE